MGLLLPLALRNLERNLRRSLMLLAAIAVAMAGVVLSNALIRGFQTDIAVTTVASLTGHVKVLHPDYRDDPGIAHRFAPPPDWQQTLAGLPVVGTAARIRVPAVLMSERQTRGVELAGIDPAEESISFLGPLSAAGRIDGRMLSGPEDATLLLGREFARELDVDVGRRVVLMALGADGRSREAGFRVAGLFDAESDGLEERFAFTGRAALAELLDADGVTELSVRLAPEADPAAARDRLAAGMPALAVSTWIDLEPQSAAMYLYADSAVLIWFAIMMVALLFGLMNALVSAVLERLREFGMLRALGMRPRLLVAQIMLESALLVGVGVVVGLAFGVLFTWLLADGIDLSRWAAGVELAGMRSLLVPRLLMADLVLVTVLALLFGAVASLYPAWQALKVDPLEAMRQ